MSALTPGQRVTTRQSAVSNSRSSVRGSTTQVQMPLQRRIPKRGFNNIFRKEFGIVNVQDLETFEPGTKIDRAALLAAGLIAKKFQLVKVLGNGELTKSLTIAVDKLSESARKKIEAAGGTIEG